MGLDDVLQALWEPRQEAEGRWSYVDPLANRPALAVSYHVPPSGTPATTTATTT